MNTTLPTIKSIDAEIKRRRSNRKLAEGEPKVRAENEDLAALTGPQLQALKEQVRQARAARTSEAAKPAAKAKGKGSRQARAKVEPSPETIARRQAWDRFMAGRRGEAERVTYIEACEMFGTTPAKATAAV